MIQPNSYITMRGEVFILSELDEDERDFVQDLLERARTHREWTDFDNYWMSRMGPFCDARGIDRKQATKTAAFRIAQDLSNRIGIEAGLIQPLDYRDDLEYLIRTEFKNRREFCEKTGISEDMLSHVLAGRKHLSMEKLNEALNRIGRKIRIVPQEAVTVVSDRQ